MADKSDPTTARSSGTEPAATETPAPPTEAKAARHPMQGLRHGRIVDYRLNRPLSAGESAAVVAAMVVGVNNHEQGNVNLQIFLNEQMAAPLFEANVSYSESSAPGTWAWPPRA